MYCINNILQTVFQLKFSYEILKDFKYTFFFYFSQFFIIFNKGILQTNKHQALDHLNIPASQCPLYPMNLRTHLQKNGLIIRFSNKLSYIMLNLN